MTEVILALRSIAYRLVSAEEITTNDSLDLAYVEITEFPGHFTK